MYRGVSVINSSQKKDIQAGFYFLKRINVQGHLNSDRFYYYLQDPPSKNPFRRPWLYMRIHLNVGESMTYLMVKEGPVKTGAILSNKLKTASANPGEIWVLFVVCLIWGSGSLGAWVFVRLQLM